MTRDRAVAARGDEYMTRANAQRWAMVDNLLVRYALFVALAELLLVFVSPHLGVLLHATALIGMAMQHVVRPLEQQRAVLLPLALVPMVRLLGFTMPVEEVPVEAWYAIVGAPALLGAVLAARHLGVDAAQLGFGQPRRVQADTAVVGFGAILGLFAHLVGAGPNLGTAPDGIGEAVALGLSFVLFVALLEEMVFRGLLQPLAYEAAGLTGIAIVTVVYATVFLGSLSLGTVLVMGAAGSAFAWARQQGASLWGLVAGHALLVIGVAIAWPALL